MPRPVLRFLAGSLRLASWLLLLRVGPAAAQPMPLLGPAGLFRLGAVLSTSKDPRGVVEVDPRTGRLWLSLPGRAGTFTWDGSTWARDGVVLSALDDSSAEDRPSDQDREWAWRDLGLLWLADRLGGQIRVQSDAVGRPRHLSWADGSQISLQRDDFGRVVSLRGPGSRDLRLSWQGKGLVAVDSGGTPLTISEGPPVGAATHSTVVVDGLGRTARTFLGTSPDGSDQILGWEDPRGLQTWVQRSERGLTVVDGSSRTWRVELSTEGHVSAASDPLGGRWIWRRNAAGQVTAIEDPAGRIHSRERDQEGLLTAAGRGPVTWRLRRDAAGRVLEIIDPIGSVVQLQRDSQGRIEKLVDPLGNAVGLLRNRTGQVQRITGRGGAVWRVQYDLLDRPTVVRGPDGRTVDLDWNLAGWLVALRAPSRETVWLDRSAAGVLTRVRSSLGRALRLESDALGRVRSLRWSSGQELGIRRDAAGQVVELRSRQRLEDGSVAPASERRLTIARDAAELPVALGGVRWKRDGAGRVVGLETPSRALIVRRDPAGQIRRLEAGDWWLELGRDRSGRVQRWSGSDGQVDVKRNSAGRIVTETVSLGLDLRLADPAQADLPETLGLSWDARGRLQRMDLAQRSWRMLRDASGRLLRSEGPDGLLLGVDRDVAGRVALLRHPAQTLVRSDWTPEDVVMAVDDAAGHRLGARLWRVQPDGAVTEEEDRQWGLRSWIRDGRGSLMAIQDNGQAGWTFSSTGSSAADGSGLRLDAAGRVESAVPPAGPPAWGVGSSALSYGWSARGPLVSVAGELRSVRVFHDELGRLSSLLPERGESTRLRYDARGRLSQIVHGGRVVQRLVWGPAVDDGPAALLASGPTAESSWMPGPWSPAGLATPGGLVDLVAGAGGEAWWWVPQAGPAVLRAQGPLGRPQISLADDSGADLAGPQGTLQLSPAGPLLALSAAEGGAVPAGVSLDPLSGQRSDGLQGFPWQARSALQDGGPAALDPDPWMPDGPWQQPLRLLVALGELEDPLPGAWTPLPEHGAQGLAVPSLPQSLDRVEPPLGPPLDALPFQEDSLTTAWLLSCLPGSAPLDADAAARVLVSSVLSLPWLPPAVSLPLPLRMDEISSTTLPVRVN